MASGISRMRAASACAACGRIDRILQRVDVGVNAEHHVTRARQAAERLALDPQPQLLARPLGAIGSRVAAVLGRPEQGGRVDQAPVEPPDRPRDLNACEEPIDRLRRGARRSRVPARGSPPAAGRACRRAANAPGSTAPPRPAGSRHRRAASGRDPPGPGAPRARAAPRPRPRGRSARPSPGSRSAIDAAGSARGSARAGGRAGAPAAPAARRGFPAAPPARRCARSSRSRRRSASWAAKRSSISIHSCEVERLDAHGEAPGAVEKGPIADHGPRLPQPSRGVKPCSSERVAPRRSPACAGQPRRTATTGARRQPPVDLRRDGGRGGDAARPDRTRIALTGHGRGISAAAGRLGRTSNP